MLELTTVITNGYVAAETLHHMLVDGWTFVVTIPAKLIHPHACETDKATIFSKYQEPVTGDSKACEPDTGNARDTPIK